MHFVPESVSTQLGDGTRLLLREVTVADRDRALDAFDRLSADDVAMRFWRDLIELDDELLDRLTVADQINHLAWCAINPDQPEEPGYAAGSVWRLKEQSDVGEVSMTVLPDFQGRGVGLVVFAILWVLSGYLGMKKLRANVLNTNTRAIEWFQSLGGTSTRYRLFTEIDFDLTARPVGGNRRREHFRYWKSYFRVVFGGE